MAGWALIACCFEALDLPTLHACDFVGSGKHGLHVDWVWKVRLSRRPRELMCIKPAASAAQLDGRERCRAKLEAAGLPCRNFYNYASRDTLPCAEADGAWRAARERCGPEPITLIS